MLEVSDSGVNFLSMATTLSDKNTDTSASLAHRSGVADAETVRGRQFNFTSLSSLNRETLSAGM